MKIQAANREATPEKPILQWPVFFLAIVSTIALLALLIGLNLYFSARMLTYLNQALGSGMSYLESTAAKARGESVPEKLTPDAKVTFTLQEETAQFSPGKPFNGKPFVFSMAKDELLDDPSYIPSLKLHPDGFFYDSMQLRRPGTLVVKKASAKLPFQEATSSWKTAVMASTYVFVAFMWVLILYALRNPVVGGAKE